MGALLHNKSKKFMMSWETWRPTVAIIETLDLFSEDQIKLMFCNVNIPVSAEQALIIANHIDSLLESDQQQIEDALSVRLRSDSTYLPWYMRRLHEFAEYCRESNGFLVG